MSTIVLVGLPGSGKTKYAKSFPEYEYVDGDELMKTASLQELCDYVNKISDNKIVDGLFLTKEIQDFLQTNILGAVDFTYFHPHVQNCLYNDSLRNREKSSAVTIRNSKVNEPKYYTGMDVPKYDYIQLLIEEFKLPKYFHSEEWTNGGSYGTCWDENGPTEIFEGTPLEKNEFTGYYYIVSKFYNLSDEEIHNKFGHLIEEKEYSESDYYGGVESRSYYNIITRDILEYIMKDVYNMTCFDTLYVKEMHPELFI